MVCWIQNARFEDMGKYECTISNKFGSDTTSGQLFVRGKILSTPDEQAFMKLNLEITVAIM